MDIAPPPLRVEPVWVLSEPDAACVEALASGLSIDPVVATLLVNRGIVEPGEAGRFLEPLLRDMPDPRVMKGMDLAVARIVRALESDETICVWGDYDVDGVTSASELLGFFSAIGHPVRSFVPDRFTDGYGLSEARIRDLAADGVDLLITVDCGVSNAHEVDVASELGMDVVVVDHHQIPPRLPDAVAVLDPVQEDCPFPVKDLAACGVTFMLLVALRRHLREAGYFAESPEPDLKEWLDLAAIGTVADMVPLRGLNRALVHHGLARMRVTRRPGVEALCQVAKVDPLEITAGRIGFHLGPRINAAGRVAQASAGVDLLTTEDEELAGRLARKVDSHNHKRRALQEEVFAAACAQADQHPDPKSRRAIVLMDPTWHPGVLGIVCSKLVDRYHRPTILLTQEDGVAKGSARSISGFRLVVHLEALSEHLLAYGGHDHAAGMSLAATGFDAFRDAFEARARDGISSESLVPRLRIDMELPLGQLTYELVDSLSRLAPYGMGNPEPSLVAHGVQVLDHRPVGKDGSHLKLTLDAAGRDLDAIAFGMANRSGMLSGPIDLVYIPEINTFRGRSRLQARIKAMGPAGSG